jgi:hypothetical protein
VFLDVESLLDARNDAERLEALKALEKAYDISWTGRTGKPFALVIPFVSSRAAKDQALARLKELESLTALQIAIWQVPKGKEREVVYAEQVSSALEHVLMLYGGGIRNKWLPRLMNLTFAPGQFIKCFDFLGYLVFLVPLVVLWPAPPWLAKIYYAICLATSGNLLLPAISRSRKPTTHREVSLCWQVWYLLSLAGCAIAALVCWLPEVISTLVSGSLLLECVTLRQGVFFLRHKFAEAVFATTGTTSRDDDTLRLLHEDARCSPITRTEPVSLNWNKVFLSHRNAGRGLVLTHLIDQHLQASGDFPTFVDFSEVASAREWLPQIFGPLAECGIFIVVLTPTVEPKWVLKELNFAAALLNRFGEPKIIIVECGCTLEDLPPLESVKRVHEQISANRLTIRNGNDLRQLPARVQELCERFRDRDYPVQLRLGGGVSRVLRWLWSRVFTEPLVQLLGLLCAGAVAYGGYEWSWLGAGALAVLWAAPFCQSPAIMVDAFLGTLGISYRMPQAGIHRFHFDLQNRRHHYFALQWLRRVCLFHGTISLVLLWRCDAMTIMCGVITGLSLGMISPYFSPTHWQNQRASRHAHLAGKLAE